MGGMMGGAGGSFKKEGVSVYLWPIHIAVWKKSIQHWKAIILQLKMNFLKAKKQDPPKKIFLCHLYSEDKIERKYPEDTGWS